MTGGLKKTTSRFAIAAAAGLFVGGIAMTPASAADLGGDCCADLEERVAELEATTARKGNRKVSLKISGQINRGMLFWDDGLESDVYFVDNTNSGSFVALSGSGNMGGGWTGGYYAKIKIRGAEATDVSQTQDGPNDDFGLDKSFLYITHKSLGTIATGKAASAADGVSEINLTGANVVIDAGNVTDWNGSFKLRPSNATATNADFSDNTWGAVTSSMGIGGTGEAIRYDTPALMGFQASVSLAGDDMFDAALRYANELGGVLLVEAGVGYSANSGYSDDETGNNGDDEDTESWGAGIALKHMPTGLNIAFNYQTVESEHELAASKVNDEETTSYYITGGISQRFFSPGTTSIYGEYYHSEKSNDNTTTATLFDANGDGTMDANEAAATVIGLGVVQAIDSAAMEMYLAYRHYEADDFKLNGVDVTTNVDEFDAVLMGARIKF
jgi:hypothetical protein